jgi:Glycosyltransferase family 87
LQAFTSRAKTLILLVFVGGLATFAGARLSDSLLGTDFPDFYCAARMLVEGHGHQLYDAALQREYQAHSAGRIGTLYIHPPFEAVLYLAVAWLPLRRAYLLWSLLHVAFLAGAVRHLANKGLLGWDWRLGLAASLTFVPVLLCLVQGQDSLLLLLLVVFAFAALRGSHAFAAGCWLALGLFKFQLILPLVLVLVLTQNKSVRSALAKGFSLVALGLAGLSAVISGWKVFTVYPKFLADLPAQQFAGIIPHAMANFRGVVYFFFHRDQSPLAIGIVSILSAAALIKTLMGWKSARHSSSLEVSSNPELSGGTRHEFDLAFANTVLFALLVSYHLNPHDLSLLLLPMVLLVRDAAGTTLTKSSRRWIIVVSALLFLPPLHLFALQTHAYALVSIPLIALFAVGTTGRGSSCA